MLSRSFDLVVVRHVVLLYHDYVIKTSCRHSRHHPEDCAACIAVNCGRLQPSIPHSGWFPGPSPELPHLAGIALRQRDVPQDLLNLSLSQVLLLLWFPLTFFLLLSSFVCFCLLLVFACCLVPWFFVPLHC